MPKNIIKKLIPFILVFTLVLPSTLGQTLPVVAADNDGESVLLAEAAGAEEEGAEETPEDEKADIGEEAEENISSGETNLEEESTPETEDASGEESTLETETVSEEGNALEALTASEEITDFEEEMYAEGLAEDIYAVPFKSYAVVTNSSRAQDSISYAMPAWNERAMVKVASGGAVSVTFQIYNSVPYDAIQVMKLEESEKLTFGVATPERNGNRALAGIPMGTFNVDEDYLAANPTIAEQWFSADNNGIYDDLAVVSRDSESGYTYLTVNLDSTDRLNNKMVVKIFCGSYTEYPVSTNFFVFDLDNIVRIPDPVEFNSGTKSVQISDVRGNSPDYGTSNLVTDDILVNVQKLFGTVEAVKGENDTLTIAGALNPEAFEGIYGVRYIRKLVNKVNPAPDDPDLGVGFYFHPYYKASFQNLDISGDRFEITFDLTTENLVFGVPLSIKTQDGLSTELPSSDEELDKLSSAYVMLHILEEVLPVELEEADGEIRLVTDTSVMPEGYGFYVSQNVEDFAFPDTYKSLEAVAAVDGNGTLSFKPYSYEIRTSSGTFPNLVKPVEIGLRIPEGWSEDEIYVTYMDIRGTGFGSSRIYTPSQLTIRDGYVIFYAENPRGEIYLYRQNVPTDLNNLEDGIYTVSISALHSGQDGRVSMADAALVKEAVLKVSTEDGKKVKELYLDFQVMKFAGIDGYLSNVGTSDAYPFDGNTDDIIWGEVLDYFTEEGTDDLLIDAGYKQDFDYTLYLVKSAKIYLQDYAGIYSDTELYKNYYPVYFEVPPMDTDPRDGIGAQAVRLMINNCIRTNESVLPTHQKTVLKKAILEGKAINGEVYTTESFNALQDVIAAAENIYSSNPDPETIKSNAEAIQAAINALVVDESKLADKTQLEAKLSEAKAIPEVNYTASSYLELQTAITAAENIYEKEAARQAEVDAQVAALEAAIDALVSVNLGATPPSRLPDGKYTIPIRLWHAIKDQASMGDAAVVRKGILEIKDGKATLKVEMLPLTFAGLTGYLMQFNILNDYTIGTSGYPENYTKIPVTVLETHDYVDQYNAEDSKDEICRGQKYPKTLQFDVTLPESTGVDYTWVHVYVPVMGELDSGDQEARLRLDYTAIVKQGEPTISLDHVSLKLTVGNKAALTAAVTDTEDTVVWTSDNSAVAAVDNAGMVTAAAPGTATITAAAGAISAFCIVTVTAEDAGSGTENGGGSGNSGGSDGDWKDGTYSIPVKLWHAQKDQASMGNAALTQTAKLVIKDGEGTLYITFKAMTYLGKKGYLAELNPSTVISTYNVVDQFNSDKSTDDRVRGIKYPKLLAVPVIPGEEYTDVNVYVPVMGSLGVGEQDARLKLYWSSAKYVSSSTKLESAASDDDLYFEDGKAVEGTGEESEEELAEETKELVTVDGVNYFYENGEKLISQLITYAGTKYYVGEDGAVLVSQFITHGGNKYYATESGAIAASVMITDNNKLYYADKEGVIVISDMIDYEGKKYYAWKTGRIAVTAIVTYQDNKYYAGKDGAIATSSMVTYKGKNYYAYKTGRIATSAMVTHDGKKYYAYKTGRIATSAMVTHNGKKYYAYKTGRIAASTMVTYKGKNYYAWKTGRIATSAIVTYKGKDYYAWKTGRIATSVMVTYKGKKYYAGKTGEIVTSKWVTIGKAKYYFDKTGKLTKTIKI